MTRETKKTLISRFGMNHPRLVVAVVLAATAFFTLQFPKVTFDNNPENMLAHDEPIRLFHDQVKKQYDLYDFVVVGVVNEGETGVWNPETLARVDRLTSELLSLHQTPEGRPAVWRDGELHIPNLLPVTGWERAMATAFKHNPERLFDEEGNPAIIGAEMISPSVVDTIRQRAAGELEVKYLMEDVPASQAEADALFEEALANPLYRNTMVSEDRKALGVYLPIIKKEYSHNIAALVEELTADWPEADQVYVTGLPVAEDTFGIEMLVQMATSAPMAGVAIFLLLLFFFRRLSLIIAPMILAVVTVLCTMGLLIGLGFDVHIMSSMIAIFLMPIAVADSVHILSEFFDTYPRFRDKRKTLTHVIGHLFSPMLFTSLTTIAGFASLGLTPIPPVKVFGLHVAFGVGLAWFLSVLLVPAYIMLFVSEKSLAHLQPVTKETRDSALGRFLRRMGRFSTTRFKLVLVAVVLLAGVAVYGISRIVVNDNPVLWFTPQHRIRVADRVLNGHFGGTYTAYLTLAPSDKAAAAPGADAVDWEALRAEAKRQDAEQRRDWNALADVIQYLEPEGLNLASLETAVSAAPLNPAVARTWLDAVRGPLAALEGDALMDAALAQVEALSPASAVDALDRRQADEEAPVFKRPEVLRWVAELQAELNRGGVVGKSNSAVDALKKAHYELNRTGAEGDFARYYSVPDTASGVGQVFLQLEGMKKKDSLFHLVTRDYREANIWFQLRSGDNQQMMKAVRQVQDFLDRNPPPVALDAAWAGLTYINVVWQERMVGGMLEALGSSFVVVLVMMIGLFRSVKFGLLSMVPLTLTIGLSYGLIGLVGKAYDMPVAVLSALTLGLSVDFAIHFLQRARELARERGSWELAWPEMFKEPAKAISRNAIVIAVGFTPLLAAPLVPYKTVGFFLATIMFVSWIASLFILSALCTLFRKRLFPNNP